MYRPFTVLCSNGDPEEKIARPSVASAACEDVHSALLVGLDRGMMTGRSLISPIASRTSSVNNPRTVLAPSKTVGRAVFTTSRRFIPSLVFFPLLVSANGRRSSTPGASGSRARLLVTSPSLSMT